MGRLFDSLLRILRQSPNEHYSLLLPTEEAYLLRARFARRLRDEPIAGG